MGIRTARPILTTAIRRSKMRRRIVEILRPSRVAASAIVNSRSDLLELNRVLSACQTQDGWSLCSFTYGASRFLKLAYAPADLMQEAGFGQRTADSGGLEWNRVRMNR